MLLHNPLLLPSNPDLSAYDGAIVVKGKQFRLKIQLGKGPEPLRSASFSCELPLRQLIQGHEATLKRRLEQSIDLDSFLTELKVFLEGRISENDRLLPPIPSYYGNVLHQLNAVGWDKIKSIDERLTRVEFAIKDKSGRIHNLTIALPSDYPLTRPKCITALPVEENAAMEYFKSSTIDGIVAEFTNSLSQFQLFWNTMDDLDSHLVISEPERPTRSDTKRRLIVEKYISLQITVDPFAARSIPKYLFLGSDVAIQPLRAKFNQSLQEWDVRMNLRENLEAMLGLQLPGPSEAADNTLTCECAICYSYKLSESEIPDKICNNPVCGKVYHTSCLREYFQSTHSRNMSNHSTFLIGQCPFCLREMTINLNQGK